MKSPRPLTKRQQKLLELINRRRDYHQPTVQRDLAEALGIRRDSLNKLLRRTRERLECHGEQLRMPERAAASRVGLVSYGESTDY